MGFAHGALLDAVSSRPEGDVVVVVGGGGVGVGLGIIVGIIVGIIIGGGVLVVVDDDCGARFLRCYWHAALWIL